MDKSQNTTLIGSFKKEKKRIKIPKLKNLFNKKSIDFSFLKRNNLLKSNSLPNLKSLKIKNKNNDSKIDFDKENKLKIEIESEKSKKIKNMGLIYLGKKKILLELINYFSLEKSLRKKIKSNNNYKENISSIQNTSKFHLNKIDNKINLSNIKGISFNKTIGRNDSDEKFNKKIQTEKFYNPNFDFVSINTNKYILPFDNKNFLTKEQFKSFSIKKALYNKNNNIYKYEKQYNSFNFFNNNSSLRICDRINEYKNIYGKYYDIFMNKNPAFLNKLISKFNINSNDSYD